VTNGEAEQIAALLNARNQLTVPYTATKVLAHADNYLTHKIESGEIVGCVEVKSVQWYQSEVLHLSVAEGHTGNGIARALLGKAAQAALAKNARVLQCTIRSGNTESEGLFASSGFSRVATFRNQASGNDVGVWQLVLSPAS
jgi:L-amino acid N-acyltransferase YncA